MEAKAERKPWQKPDIRKIELTDEEREALRSSDDPMALFLKLKGQPPAKG
jgi:hypothetical protein